MVGEPMQIGEIGTKSEINGIGRWTHGPPSFLTKTFGPKVRLGRKISVEYGLGGPSFWWGVCRLHTRPKKSLGSWEESKARGFLAPLSSRVLVSTRIA